MKTSVEKLEGVRVRLAVTVEADEVDRYIAKAYADAAKSVKIPGFRKGHVPRPVIDRYVGGPAVLGEALEDVVGDTYPRALDAEALRPIERPDTGDLDELEPGKPYTYTVEVDVRPELTLSSVDDLTIAVPSGKTSDREIDAQIEYLRDRFASLMPVEGRGVGPDDFVLLSFTGTVDGKEYEGNTVDGYLYEMGRGGMPKEFDDAMLGAEPGSDVVAEFVVPDTSSNTEFVGKTARFEIHVTEIKAKTLPEADDEFAASVGGFDTIAELRGDIRDKLDENKLAGHIRMVEREARRALSERLVGEVPQAMIDSEADGLERDFLERLDHEGMSIAEYAEAVGLDAETVRADIRKEAASRAADELALEALFRAKGFEITDEMVTEEIERIASAEKTDAAKLRERLEHSGVLPMVREDLMHRTAVRWLMDNVKVIDENPEGEKAAPAKKPAGKKKSAAKKPAADKEA